MKYGFSILALVLAVSFAPVDQAAAINDVMIIQGHATPLGPLSKSEEKALRQGLPGQSSSAKSGQSAAAVFRDVPSISGSYSVGGATLMPYVGAGFGSGYTSELDRSLNSPAAPATESGLRSQFGQSFSPNEFQLGIRIPF